MVYETLPEYNWVGNFIPYMGVEPKIMVKPPNHPF